jgi:hypothetical protein
MRRRSAAGRPSPNQPNTMLPVHRTGGKQSTRPRAPHRSPIRAGHRCDEPRTFLGFVPARSDPKHPSWQVNQTNCNKLEPPHTGAGDLQEARFSRLLQRLAQRVCAFGAFRKSGTTASAQTRLPARREGVQPHPVLGRIRNIRDNLDQIVPVQDAPMPPVAFDFLGPVAGPRAQTELPTHIDLGHRQQRRAGLDGKVEEPRRSVKYEDIYLKDYERVDDL